MQITPAATELHINHSRGVAPLVGVKTAPARADKAAPPAIIMALPSPEALVIGLVGWGGRGRAHVG